MKKANIFDVHDKDVPPIRKYSHEDIQNRLSSQYDYQTKNKILSDFIAKARVGKLTVFENNEKEDLRPQISSFRDQFLWTIYPRIMGL